MNRTTLTIFVTGADGFIGQRLVPALLRRGHRVIGCARHRDKFNAVFPELPFVTADFTRDYDVAQWIERLRGADAVINAVGIFREQGIQSYVAVHTLAPIALFDACVRHGVRRIIQISALGADANARSRYHLSKKAADDHLAQLDLEWSIVQPSLVYAANGASARLFNTLASLPLIPLPASGDQQLQPIYLDDAVEAIAALLEPGAPARQRIPLVGSRPISLRDYLSELRAALGLPTALFVPVPLWLVRSAAHMGRWLPQSLLTEESLDMLLRGNTAESRHVTALLGRAPRQPRTFIEPANAAATRQIALMAWLLPPLRWSIALVWIVSGIVSLGVYPVEYSYELLARTGITGALATMALYGAALLDLTIGIAILVFRRRRWLWIGQIALIAGYSLILAWAIPELWLHPFGPLIKNFPMLIGIVMLLMLED